MFAINVNGSLSLAAQVLLVGATFFHFNLISGMPFNPNKASSPIISNLAMLSGINFS
jgi:hypothetical protein